MMLIEPGGRSFGVTFVHVLPPSRVRCTSPVLAPAHITAGSAEDRASVVIEPPCAGPLTVLPPATASDGSLTLGGAARSGLIVRHVRPRSSDASTCCAAM